MVSVFLSYEKGFGLLFFLKLQYHLKSVRFKILPPFSLLDRRPVTTILWGRTDENIHDYENMYDKPFGS